MIEISKRLEMIASCVPEGSIVADIGTDHAYLPIYLVQSGRADRVIAMDVNRGPLGKASQNIQAAGVSQSIELRLSDGLSELKPGEADVITISGIGGRLMQRILADGIDRISPDTKLILSPQSELLYFRVFIAENGFVTEDEMMLKEDGKYYVIIKCCLSKLQRGTVKGSSYKDSGMSCRESAPDQDVVGSVYYEDIEQYACLKYGKHLIDKKDAVLTEFIRSKLSAYKALRAKLGSGASGSAKERLLQIEKDINAIQHILDMNDVSET